MILKYRLLDVPESSNDHRRGACLHRQEQDSARLKGAKLNSLVNSVVNTNEYVFYDFCAATRSQKSQWNFLIQDWIW